MPFRMYRNKTVALVYAQKKCFISATDVSPQIQRKILIRMLNAFHIFATIFNPMNFDIFGWRENMFQFVGFCFNLPLETILLHQR